MNVITMAGSSSSNVSSLSLRKRLSKLKSSWKISKTSLKTIASIGAECGVDEPKKIKNYVVQQLSASTPRIQNSLFKGGRQGSGHFWWAAEVLSSEINPYNEILNKDNSSEELAFVFDRGEYFGF